jgi:hypothetical protein
LLLTAHAAVVFNQTYNQCYICDNETRTGIHASHSPTNHLVWCCLFLQSAAAFDGQPGSQLLLVGSQHVHALYAALLALPWCEPGQPDVPLLSAPVPFLHAQLCPLRLVVSL